MTVTDNDKLFKALRAEITKLGRTTITVGVHGDERERDGGELDNVQIAAVHEFGAPAQGIPARSFLRAAVDERLGGIGITAKDLAERVGTATMSAKEAGAQLGAFVAGVIQARMSNGLEPPLSQKTLVRRAQRTKRGRKALATIKRLSAKARAGKALTGKQGAQLASAQALITNAKPLIDTGQLRQSIAYKVKQ